MRGNLVARFSTSGGVLLPRGPPPVVAHGVARIQGRTVQIEGEVV